MDQLDEDGLPASEVGAWTEEKHERLRRYVDSSHGARRRFKSRSYVDLYCGPGRSWVRETGAFIDGSPLVAFDSAAKHRDQFTEIFISDARPDYLAAADKRLQLRGANVRSFSGEASAVIKQVIASLDPDGPKDLDDFAPGWRNHVDTKRRQDIVRQEIFDYWRSLINHLGTSPNDCIEVVENSKGADLYWLVFVARHALAHKLWQAVSNVSPQGRLSL